MMFHPTFSNYPCVNMDLTSHSQTNLLMSWLEICMYEQICPVKFSQFFLVLVIIVGTYTFA